MEKTFDDYLAWQRLDLPQASRLLLTEARIERQKALLIKTAKRLEIWKQRVGGSVTVKEPGDIEKIARLCMIAEDKGQNCSTWHQSGVYYGNSYLCPCFPCSEARKKEIGSCYDMDYELEHRKL